MANPRRTWGEMAAPDYTYEPSGVVFPAAAMDFEIKSNFLHHLPKFNGHSTENPHRHLKVFVMTCDTMRSPAVDPDLVKLKAFPFSLEGGARDWYYSIPHQAVNSWLSMKRLFLEKYFPASRVSALKKEISGIQQKADETLSEYWERFQALCDMCPHHGYSEVQLLEQFYEGLGFLDRKWIDSAAGGILKNQKTPEEARQLISEMANHSRYEQRANRPTRGAFEVTVDQPHAEMAALTGKVDKLTDMINVLTMGQPSATPCTLCPDGNIHTPEQCPLLLDDQATVAAMFPGKPGTSNQPRYDPYSNTYNPGWKDHPALKWNNNSNVLNPQHQARPFQQQPPRYVPPPQRYHQQQQQQQPHQQQHQQQQQQQPRQWQPANPPPPPPPVSPTPEGPVLQELLKMIQEMNGRMQAIEQSQASSSTGLPAQTVPNPRANVSAIALRSGTIILSPPKADIEDSGKTAGGKDSGNTAGGKDSGNIARGKDSSRGVNEEDTSGDAEEEDVQAAEKPAQKSKSPQLSNKGKDTKFHFHSLKVVPSLNQLWHYNWKKNS